MDFPGRLIAGFLAVILLFIFPLQYIAQMNSENIDTLVDNRTHQFTDSVRVRGYLDKQMYEEYAGFLDATGERYGIELQDIRPVKGEEYSRESNSGLMRTASFEKISHNEIQSFATHTHTANCYAGNLHVCNGIDCEYEGEAIVVGIRGFSLYYSKNGVTWTSASTSVGGSGFRDITYGNGKYVAIDGYSIYTSTDGSNWTKSSFDISDVSGKYKEVNKITYADNGFFYAVAKYTVSSPSRNYTYYLIVKSSDGLNWTRSSNNIGVTSETSSASNIAVTKMGDGTWRLYVQLSGYHSSVGTVKGSGYYIINSDGNMSSFVSNVYPNKTADSLVREIDGYAVINNVYQYDSNKFYCGNLFGSITININNIPTVIQYGDGIYLSIHTGSKSLYISDTISNFPKVTNHNLSIPSSISSNMIYYGDKFLFSGGGRVYMSPDGLSWTSASAPIQFTKLVCNANRGTGEIERGECLKQGKYYDNSGNEVNPICDKVVTSITATNPAQTVDKGRPIITSATATYLDGHTGIVNCTSNYNPNLVGNQTVTLTYTGLVGNAKTTGTRTCTINVTVRPVNILTSVTVLPALQTIQRYTSPSFTVRANYNDGTNKLLNASQYSITGFNASKIGLQSVTISYTENGITKTAKVNVTVTVLLKECPRCHQLYELNPDDSDPGCPNCRELITGIEVTPNYVEVTQGENIPITVMAIYNDGTREEVNGWTSNYNPARIGLQSVTVQYRGYAADVSVWVNEVLIICPICDTEYPASEESCPVCAEKVVRISASPKEITVTQYELIPLTVTAYYADGESAIVDDWMIDRTTVSPGTFIATVSYKGVSDTITLTVLSINSIECPICGTIYDISDSPKGCPICSEEIIGIEAYLTSGSNLVQLGTTPAIAVILLFRDEHREFAPEGYTLEDYNSHELGIQTVKVLYKEFTTTIIIEVVNMLDSLTCPNGHVYYKNSDGSDPGCPFCYEGEDFSKIAYFDITYTTEILDTLYSIGVYHIQEGNYISVIVIKKDKSLLYRLQRTFFSTSLLGRKKRYIYGGEVY